jgi:hypothetical protein
MPLVTSCDRTNSRSAVRKEPAAIRNRKDISVATHVELGTTILPKNETKGAARLAFADDFLWEHSFSVAQSGNRDIAVCTGKSNPERSAPSEFCGFCS